jgi:hypothetical protein
MSVTRDKSTLASDPCQWFATTEKPNTQTPGLTKREYFAALAMQAQISSDNNKMLSAEEWMQEPKRISSWAVMYADALIEELNK